AARAAGAGCGCRSRCRNRAICGRRNQCARLMILRGVDAGQEWGGGPGAGGGSGFAAGEALVEAKDWHPPRMVLLVESDLALAVGHFCLVACRRHRPSAPVNDCDFRSESDSSTTRPDRCAKVDVLGVHEIVLIEEAG